MVSAALSDAVSVSLTPASSCRARLTKSRLHNYFGAMSMKIPGPDHPITVTPNEKRVRVTFAGTVIADTARALTLKEATYPPMQYIPREDADMDALVRTDHHTHCPYKGDAGYFSIKTGEREAGNAVWSYEQPYPAVAQIAGYLCFYASKVDKIEEVS
jgi:uncharacterized protein (DUF427 family)